jgi:hypothetical protein
MAELLRLVAWTILPPAIWYALHLYMLANDPCTGVGQTCVMVFGLSWMALGLILVIASTFNAIRSLGVAATLIIDWVKSK